MKPVVLLVGRMKDVIGATTEELSHLPVEWLGAHNREEVLAQIAAEPNIACVIIGGTIDEAFCSFVERIVKGTLVPA